MPETPFEIGAKATTTDAAHGQVSRIVVDPTSRAVTHVAILLGRHERLVPVDLVQVTADGLQLNCTRAEFDKLKPGEITEFMGGSWQLYTRGETTSEYAQRRRQTLTYESVPWGEVDVRPGDQVYATDGEIGLVEGLAIDPADHRVTHVILQEGHLWGHKAVAIPVSAVTEVRAGIRLNVSKQQVENLPPWRPTILGTNPLTVE
jgi:sporulation protein YlmC with PRC-barrel domain